MIKKLLTILFTVLALTSCKEGDNSSKSSNKVTDKVENPAREIKPKPSEISIANEINVSDIQFNKGEGYNLTISANVTNNSSRNIKGIQFLVNYDDMFGNRIAQKSYMIKEILNSGETKTFTWKIYSTWHAAEDLDNIKYGGTADGKIYTLVKNGEVRVTFINHAIAYEDGTLVRNNDIIF
ncbi:MAG: hypothetical protein IKI30_06175 [Oxalobacter sp.]|nr:hypothetical protein [Oxalobacter sp.]